MVGSSDIELPRGLLVAQGYLELATGPAARLGLAIQLRRQALRSSLLAAVSCRIDPGDDDVDRHRSERFLLIGQTLRLLGRHDLAVRPLTLATENPTTYRDAGLGLAWCQRRMGNLRAAILTTSRTLSTLPGDADLHYNLACYLALALHSAESLRELSWAIELKPRLRARAACESDFDSLRGSAAFEELLRPGVKLAHPSIQIPAPRHPYS
ncbi:MAG: hypothetical protein EA381_13755 [Planctomycetaceae bacterium]|nr:MAG: hypothetical protein EA381_13755 [Planctomycetaceae bacterium]